jgi:hypothetical protein
LKKPLPIDAGQTDLNINIASTQRIFLDECAPGLNFITHQRSEDLIGGNRIFDLDFEQATR